MYTEYYHFHEKPFGLTPNPAYLFLGESHREALNHLNFGIQQKEGFILITGDVGTGKTTLCRTLLSQLKNGYQTAYIFNPVLSLKDLLKNILEELGETVKPGKTKRDLIVWINQRLLDFYRQGIKTVLIIDEAQDLSSEVLENIRLLSNLETTRDKLLQIVLVGQPELEKKLSLHSLRQLNQRITIRYHLKALTFEETRDYIHHRIIIAGNAASVRFDDSAVRVIYRLSRGIPRLINQLCDRALLAGYVAQRRDITGRLVKKGLQSLQPKKSPPFKVLRWVGISAGIIFILVGGYLSFRTLGKNLLGSYTQNISLKSFVSEKSLKTKEPLPRRTKTSPTKFLTEGGTNTRESH